MKKDFLLTTREAQGLYEIAAALPIIDYHNHVSVSDIATNRRYSDITALWLESDPYKHRLMRICGVPEHFITGDASPYEKFERFCEVFPYFAGNPVYDWSRMELSSVFGIDTLPCKENAALLYDRTGEMLRSAEFSNNALLAKFSIEYQSPVASLLDDLSLFKGVAPSLRADNLLSPAEEFRRALTGKTGVHITDDATYVQAVGVMLDRFAAAGCAFADHALDADFFRLDTDGRRRSMLIRLAAEYKKRGFTLLLHLGAKRETSPRLRALAGPAGGYAAAGEGVSISALADLLGAMEGDGGLPDTVLFPLNMGDQAPLAVMHGSYAEDGVPSKVQLGPAWWWCDHALGIRNTLSAISSFGLLSQFIGMTTDSRSVLSFVRHDYFRRLLCSFIAEQNAASGWEMPKEIQEDYIRKICYQNARDKIKKEI